MASYVIAASLFIIGSSYLLHFVIEPPGGATGGLEHLDLRSKAVDALGILVGSPGVPSDWQASASAIDSIRRLGLVEGGTSIRLDPWKFDALAKGKLMTTSGSNAAVDYAEAKAALGLSGYEFHLRAYPLLTPTDGDPYGLSGFGSYRVAYVGDFAGNPPVEQSAAIAEIAQLDGLNIDFAYGGPLSTTDDVIPDTSGHVRDELLPNIGANVQQTILSGGSGPAHKFYRVPASTYAALAPGTGQSRALALSPDGATLGYSKNLEIRAIVGKADLRDAQAATLTWKEWVDTDRGNLSYDCQDFGYVEVSPDQGQTWIALTAGAADRSDDCSNPPTATPHPAALVTRSVADLTLACPACDNNAQVLIGFRWVADNDNTRGYGWVIDDVQVSTLGGTVMRKTFEDPEYDMVIIGSEVDNHALEPQDVKEAIRDYVDLYGGRILVTGPSDTSVNWLDRLFDAGISGASAGVSTPDTTHPLLTLPNALSYESYEDPEDLWDFGGSDDATLFTAVMAESADMHALSVSRLGAWGSGSTEEGSLILSAYQPYSFDIVEARRFYANSITYGKFHYLYLDYGPAVPTHEAVASATRTATMNMHRFGDPAYAEMAFILYIWPGASAAATAGDLVVPASPPLTPAVSSTPLSSVQSSATLTWTAPLSSGSAAPIQYRIYRGHSPDAITTEIGSVPDTTLTYVDTPISNGVTYYYAVRLETAGGALGTPSAAVSVTPVGPPGEPTGLAAQGLAGKVRVTWAAPVSTGGGTIFGYRVSASTDGATYAVVGEIGNVTTFDHVVSDTTPRTYKAAALNAHDWGALSAASNAAAAIMPIDPPTLSVARGPGPGNLTLTWVAPDVVGQTLQGYRVHRASTPGGTYAELVYLNDPANLSFTDAGLGPNATRYYKVQGVTEFGDGLLSAERSAKTMGTPDTPTWGTIARTPVSHHRTLTWNAVVVSDHPVVRYDVFRSPSAGGALELVGASSTTTYVDNPGPGTFHYAVKAVSAAGSSDASERLANAPTPINAPVLSVAQGAGPNNLTLTWTKPVPYDALIVVTGYRIQYALASSGPFVDLVTVNDANTLTHTDQLAIGSANVTRHYKVVALTNDGDSSASDVKNAKTMGAPDTPTWGTAVKDPLTGARTLTWIAPASDWPVAHYEIYRASSANGVLESIGQSLGGATSYVDSPGNGARWYAVRAVSPAGASDMSARIQST